MKKHLSFTTYLFFILCIFYAMGVFFHLYEPSFNTMKQITPYVLVVHALIVFLQVFISQNRDRNIKKWIAVWLLISYIITMAIEILAVQTGAIFGVYTYGETLGFQLLGVPVLIGLNWCLVMFSVFETMRVLRVSLALGIIMGSLCVLFFDIILEPFAIGALGYWQWEGGHVPAQNYFAWFVIAFIFSVLYCWLVPYSSKPQAEQLRESTKPRERTYRFSNDYFPLLMLCLHMLFMVSINIGFAIG